MRPDYLIVGSGLTGATIARTLADAGREVLIVERRSHLGGNVHDHTHESGIRVHAYGPHYFRTSSEEIWEFANRFGKFYPYQARVMTQVDGRLEQWPVTREFIKRICPGWQPGKSGDDRRNFKEAALAKMPPEVYHLLVKGYTEKQWGVPAHTLDASLCKRFEIREDDDPRLTPNAKHQGIPDDGYAEWMRRMISGIPVILNYDWSKRRSEITPRKLLIFTGPIDEFFGFTFGKLAYRSQMRETHYLPKTDEWQPCGQVNDPRPDTGYIRTLEWKHMMPPRLAERISGTVVTRERPFTPADPNDYEYPFPNAANQELYRAYRRKADAWGAVHRVLFCGRLGEYRYLDMDQAMGRALVLARRVLAGEDLRAEVA